MQENMQAPIAADYKTNGDLRVHSVFLTIQGEGPFCGERALFVRLFGCNLRCPGCDTEYTRKDQLVASGYLVTKAQELNLERGHLIVITGGEPLRQNIVPAVIRALHAGYRVQVETNGVLCPEGMPWTHPRFSVVCSPKTARIHSEIMEHARAFKYVVRANEIDPADGLPTRALMHRAAPCVARPRKGALTFVQPMDEIDTVANSFNLSAAISSTIKFGHRLQIQVHKIINLE